MKENNSTPAITPIPKEIPFQREVEYHGHVIDVATEQLSKFFGLNLEPPDLLIQLGSEGDPVAQGERIDGKYSVILRPNFKKRSTHKPGRTYYS